jgi:Tfp pilus assembly protein PilX
MKRTFTRQPKRRQHGAAALIVVMLLFFLISMVAAYTSRNLVFEQRTASNQYRSTLALEAAEAGLEWGIAQLNAGRVDSSCVPSTADSNATHLSFRERHLTVDAFTGALTRRTAATSSTPVRAGCVFNGTAWDCACSTPGVAATALPAAGTANVQPAFIVRVDQSSALAAGRPQVVEMQSNSCTRRDDDSLLTGTCLNFTSLRGGTGDGVASVRTLVTLRGAFTTTPGAALTLGGSLSALPLGTTLTLQNTDSASNGVTLHTAGAASGLPATGLFRVGLPGVSPANSTVAADATLTPVAQGGFSANDRRFALFFGMRPDTYVRQPGLPTIDCTAGCSAAAINTTLLRNPGRPIWLQGAGTVTIDTSVGSSATPALLIVDGDLVFSSSATVTGMIYQRDLDNSGSSWSLSGNTAVQGAVVVEGNLTITGTSAGLAVNYNPALLRQLRVSYGTYVRVPGGWRDF